MEGVSDFMRSILYSSFNSQVCNPLSHNANTVKSYPNLLKLMACFSTRESFVKLLKTKEEILKEKLCSSYNH